MHKKVYFSHLFYKQIFSLLQILLSRISGKNDFLKDVESSVVVVHFINNMDEVLGGWIGEVELPGRIYVRK